MKNKYLFLIILSSLITCKNKEVIKSSDILSIELTRLSDDRICQFTSQVIITSLVTVLNDSKNSDVIKISPRYRIEIQYELDKEILVLGSKNTFRKKRGKFESDKRLPILIEELLDSCE